MRNDAGQTFVIMRVLPGTFAVHGDPEELISFHTDWEGAKAAFIAAVGKNKRPIAKLDPHWASSAAMSATVNANALRTWKALDGNKHIAEKYMETYCFGLIGLAYANGILISFGEKFYFLSGEEEIPAILDEYEEFRYPPKLTPKPEAGTGRLTIEELDQMLAEYGLGQAQAAAPAEENSPL